MERFESGKLDKKDVATDFNWGESYSKGYFGQLKKGATSVTVELMGMAAEKHGLNPMYLFGLTEHPEIVLTPDFSFVAEGEQQYVINDSIGNKIEEMLKKHKIPKLKYAESLGISARTFQRVLSGETEPSFALVSKIAEDLAEPLDAFRYKPLPQGHQLQLLREREERILEQAATIELLQKTVAKLIA